MRKCTTIIIGSLLAASAVTLWLLTGTGLFYPGGAISFIGMNKQQVIHELNSLRIPWDSHSSPYIHLSVRSTGKYYQTEAQALADPFIMTEDLWQVNPRSRLWAMFVQQLEFGADGRVQAQTVSVGRDGP